MRGGIQGQLRSNKRRRSQSEDARFRVILQSPEVDSPIGSEFQRVFQPTPRWAGSRYLYPIVARIPSGVPMSRWLRVVASLVTVTATLAASDVQERELRCAIAEADRGASALAKGNIKKARESFQRSLAAVSDFPNGHLGLGQIAMRESRFEDALNEFCAAESGYKDMSSLTIQLAAARYSRSRDELEELRVRLSQLDSRAMRSQTPVADGAFAGPSEGELARERTQVQARIRALEGMQPPSSATAREAPAEVLFFKGNALFNLKRLPEAIAVWEAAIARDPKLPLVQNNLAVAYWMTGRLEDARTAMERAEALGFKVNPNFRADLARAIAAK
jgi:tetratricopeptide (TPR) repeat protein